MLFGLMLFKLLIGNNLVKWVCTPGRLKPVFGQQTRDWNKDKADDMEKLIF